MLWVVHGNHGAKELVELYRKVANVGSLSTAEQCSVTAHMPDVVVTSEGAITAAGRKW